ncbi:hypothetical protein OE88DRAFT_1165410 [Heliocybe sulcata]|uniref:Uncharacterized protein n=1 Tax=Heliocybe sulcata TaxID=5364 RepID=A0A5C3NAC4_9AGAM|nr:hypothetical protein OE88DRAFT_1165410 [Heliocybe sulcata]
MINRTEYVVPSWRPSGPRLIASRPRLLDEATYYHRQLRWVTSECREARSREGAQGLMSMMGMMISGVHSPLPSNISSINCPVAGGCSCRAMLSRRRRPRISITVPGTPVFQGRASPTPHEQIHLAHIRSWMWLSTQAIRIHGLRNGYTWLYFCSAASGRVHRSSHVVLMIGVCCR